LADLVGNRLADGVVPGVVVATTTVVESEGAVMGESPLGNTVIVPGEKLEETVGVKPAEVAVVGLAVAELPEVGYPEVGFPEVELTGGGVPPPLRYAGGGTAVDGSLSLPVPQGIA